MSPSRPCHGHGGVGHGGSGQAGSGGGSGTAGGGGVGGGDGTGGVGGGSPPLPPGDTGGGDGIDAPRGPQTSIACQGGAILIPAGSTTASRQALINTNPSGTAFCLEAGAHSADGSNTPKSGNIFTGVYGAVIDATGWSTIDPTQAVFRAHNENIDDVTIRNLKIVNAPQYAVRSYVDFSSGWLVEFCEFGFCNFGIEVCHDSRTLNNLIHHSTTAAYTGNTPHDVLFGENTVEDTSGAANQKLVEGFNHHFRSNIFRRQQNGIWEDGDNHGVLIEGNLIEDCNGVGIFYEISGVESDPCIIRNNTVRRASTHGILLSTSRGVEVHNNFIEDCFRGIWLQVNLDIVGGGAIPGGWDLIDDFVHDNIVRLSTLYAVATPGSYVTGFDYSGTIPPGDPVPYLTGLKNLLWARNQYSVPDTDNYWFNGGSKSWEQWQALPQDAGSVRFVGGGSSGL